MLFGRYCKNHEIIDQEVTLENAHSVYRNLKRKYLYADLIMVGTDGVEHCVL